MSSLLVRDGAELPEGKCALITVQKLEEGANTGNKPCGRELRTLIPEKENQYQSIARPTLHSASSRRSMIYLLPHTVFCTVETAV